MKLTLSNGSSPRGAQMGRPNIVLDKGAPYKLQMERLQWVDGDYDQWGAYWGNSGDYIYCAHLDNPNMPVQVFVRAHTRTEAKSKVRAILPHSRFYR